MIETVPDCTRMIESKKSKVESSLCELYNEISTATKYLLQLKENSAAVVKNLENISSPSTFLQEFMNVNSFLLKSINFLTEINCKFEMLDISDKWVKNFISNNKSKTLSEIADEAGEKSNCESSKEVSTSGSNNKELKNVIADKPSVCTSGTSKEKKTKKKKSKKSQPQKCENKHNNSNCAKITTTRNTSSCNNISVNAFSHNNSSNSPITGAKQKSNSDEETGSISSDSENNSEMVLSAEECVSGKIDQQISPILESGSCQNNLEKTKETSCAGIFNSSVDNKSPSAKVVSNAVHTSGDIPVAEVVPTKIIDWWSNSKVPDEIKCSEGPGGDKLAASQIKTEKDDEVDDIKTVEIVRKLDEEYDVIIEHIKSPSEFYVSLAGTQRALLKEMEEKLKLIPLNNDAHGRKDKCTKGVLSSKIGKYALVYLKCEEMWYRAKITNWSINYNDNFVNVFLLDYGESKCVSIYDIQPMPECFKQYPAFIVRCHLFNVFPIDMDMSSTTISWGKESCEKMKSLTENCKWIRVKVAPDDCFHPSSSLPVIMWSVDQDNKCINELLVKTKYAIHGSKLNKSETEADTMESECNNNENDILNKWNPMKEDFESYQNTYDLDMNDPSAMIYGYVGRDHERICKHYANTGHCFKGETCRKEHEKLDHLGYTRDKEEIYQSAFYDLTVPPPKSVLNVQVTCLLNFNKFFCFLETDKASPKEENLQSLLKYMNKKENVLKMKQLLIPPSPGQIVIARYSEDEAWYRARILESQPENDKYTVVFVDYGNKETKPLSQIRAIEAQYLHLPFQAVQCFIFGIEENPGVSLKEVMDYTRERMDDGHISIEVIARLPGEHINLLVNVFDQEGRNIGEDLISKNYALRKEEMVINFGSDTLPG